MFSEIYSAYYDITERILRKKEVTKAEIQEVIRSHGFSETMLFLEPELTGEDDFGLLKKSGNMYRSILKKSPRIPLTTLEKRWLSAVLRDRKCGLFLDKDQRRELLEILGAEPLFSADQFCFFDRYSDGDDYENEGYIKHFRDILTAINEKRLVKITFNTRKGNRITHYFLPVKLEYSSKNDRFRAYVIRYKRERPVEGGIINLSQVTLTELTEIVPTETAVPFEQKKTAVVRVLNERNAVNRFMMEFAELERVSEYDEASGECIVRMKYRLKDETEILIRILSFGAMAEVIEPADLRGKIKERVQRQNEFITI